MQEAPVAINVEELPPMSETSLADEIQVAAQTQSHDVTEVTVSEEVEPTDPVHDTAAKLSDDVIVTAQAEFDKETATTATLIKDETIVATTTEVSFA